LILGLAQSEVWRPLREFVFFQPAGEIAECGGSSAIGIDEIGAQLLILQRLDRSHHVFAQKISGTACDPDCEFNVGPGQNRLQIGFAGDKNIRDLAFDLDHIRGYVTEHKIVGIPPNAKAQVRETPQYDRATSFASMDTPGPFEKKATEAFYYVTPVDPTWTEQQKEEWLTSFNYYTADVTSIHEAYPGHYVQFLRLNASSANKIEKIFGSYAFIEGWAHYCEQMMLDQGFGGAKKPPGTAEEQTRAAKYRMAQASEALLRLCRLCVSVKMHTQGMSIDEATKFFRENCYYEEKPARSEAMRGTFDYGYLNYSLGKMEILKLRDDYKAQQDAEFSLEQFHNQLLDHGMPPIRLLREILLKDKAKWDDVL